MKFAHFCIMQSYKLYEVVFLLTDQPATCPLCGARTDILLDMSHTVYEAQVHQCLSAYCQFEFATQTDLEYVA